MTAEAWIFAAAWLVLSAAFVLVARDREEWRDRALTHRDQLDELMAHHAAVRVLLAARGIHIIDPMDVRHAETPADLLDIPSQWGQS